jgi:hypothetical protein
MSTLLKINTTKPRAARPILNNTAPTRSRSQRSAEVDLRDWINVDDGIRIPTMMSRIPITELAFLHFRTCITPSSLL